jgi:hypothetical protein
MLESALSEHPLNHRLPWREAHSQVAEHPADFLHQISDALFPQADPIFDGKKITRIPNRLQ